MVCGQVLSGEYMGKDGQPYCEKGIAGGNFKLKLCKNFTHFLFFRLSKVLRREMRLL
jgi:hypothetical protein